MYENGKTLKEEGMQRALDSAEKREPGWQDRALVYLRAFPNDTFMAEEIRAWAYGQGLDRPPSERAWGGVMAAARKMGLITPIGFKQVSNPKAHQTPASLWQKEVFVDLPKGQQSLPLG